jgi:hypothetical protein
MVNARNLESDYASGLEMFQVYTVSPAVSYPAHAADP